MDATDHDLLRQFNAHRSEDAFRQLVNRHVGMVFSVASRVTGDSHLAEEISQTTFATLAQKAGSLHEDDVIAGWLYHTARHLALRAVRSEQRRRQREQIAATMNTNEPGPNVVAEHLESAMDQLSPADRDALVLRYFEDRNLRDIGHELGLTEDAARMRVNRALEKLRGVFGKLGITGSAAWLGTTLTPSATASVPAGLGATITTAVLGGTAIAAATTALVTQTTATTMNLFNLKTAVAIIAAAAVTGTTTYFVQERESEQLRAENQTLNETHAKLANDQQAALAMVQLRDEQIAALKRDAADVHRLRGEVDRFNRELMALSAVRADNESLRREISNLAAKLVRTQDLKQPTIQQMEEAEKEAMIERINQMRRLALGQIMYADDNEGWFPQDMNAAAPYLKDGPDNVELLFRGNTKDIAESARTLIARDRHVQTFANGRLVRTYIFADGQTVVKAAGSMQEFAEWEKERSIPTELQSRRPEQ